MCFTCIALACLYADLFAMMAAQARLDGLKKKIAPSAASHAVGGPRLTNSSARGTGMRRRAVSVLCIYFLQK